MQGIQDAVPRHAVFARGFTTALCCAWGFSFAYVFFGCIMDRSGPLVCLAAALPLLAVWGALDRKRWARIVLVAQSLLAYVLFALMFATLAFSHTLWLAPAEHHLTGYLQGALRLFGETPEATLGVLVLSALTAIWFCLPWTRREYENRKKPFLTPGQKVIAISVLSAWGLTMISTPAPAERRSPDVPLKTPRRLTLRY